MAMLMLESSSCIRAFSCWSYLVAQTLRGNDGNLITNSLVCLEIESQLGVVSFDDDLRGLLDSLRANATHDCGCEEYCRKCS